MNLAKQNNNNNMWILGRQNSNNITFTEKQHHMDLWSQEQQRDMDLHFIAGFDGSQNLAVFFLLSWFTDVFQRRMYPPPLDFRPSCRRC